MHNCAAKAAFVLRALRATNDSVLWIDADAELLREVSFFDFYRDDGHTDFAIYRDEKAKHAKWKFRSGTVWFNQTEAAHDLCQHWADLCDAAPDRLDQESLYIAWAAYDTAAAIRTHWLPMTYCQRFDEPDGVPDPHIVHYQASRETRKKRAGRMG